MSGNDTAMLFESSMIHHETSDVVRSIQDARACCRCFSASNSYSPVTNWSVRESLTSG